VKLLSTKRAVAALGALLIVLFLFRPGVSRLRHRIAGSIGTALGRRVEIDNVRVRALPQPGFDLEGLVIYDDPAFSPEPMVRAQDVTATIRLRSLLRGRLEIARLSATEPSINLVRNHEGRWNLAQLLERSARIPIAPTGKAPSERRPAFPYLEAVHARINFKIEQEKKAYSLIDADVGLWQESENSWGARMRAEPVRTDFNLTDTGLVSLNATWQRAPNLHSTPVQISLEWQKGQLGQISKLLTGRDRGWRGGVDISANLSGTPEALRVESQAAVTEFHRYDIAATESVRLAVGCAGRYSINSGTLADLQCESPLTSGSLKVGGTLGPIRNGLNYDLTVATDKVPLASFLRVLRQAKKQLPQDLIVAGLVRAEIHAVRDADGPVDIDGEGVGTNVRLIANGGKNELVLGDVPLTFVTAPVVNDSPDDKAEAPQPQMRIGTLALATGGTAPATAGGWISPSGYRFMLTGDFALKNLFQLADGIGLGGSRPAVDGLARGAIDVSGAWQGFAPATIVARAQLRSGRAVIRGVNTPVQLASAVVRLLPDSVSLDKISAQTGTTHWSGSASATRHCAPPDCILQFDLSADRLSAGDLYAWFATPAAKRPWYRLLNLGEQTGPSPLLEKRARGTLRIGKLELKKVIGNQVSTQVSFDRGKISLSNLRAQLLQGSLQGNWTIDVTARSVKYQTTGTLQNISLDQLSALMNESWVTGTWITGTGDARFAATASGLSFADLLDSATATLRFSMKNGSLPHIDNPGSTGPLSVHKLDGDLQLDNGMWQLSTAKLETHDGIFQIKGRASAENGLNFSFQRNDDQSWTLSGTLAKPRLERTSRTQAAVVPAKQ